MPCLCCKYVFVSGEIGACILRILLNTVALSYEVQFGALYNSVLDFHLTNGTIAVYVANPQHIYSLVYASVTKLLGPTLIPWYVFFLLFTYLI